MLLEEFRGLKIKYEAAQLTGKPKKRDVVVADIEALEPFHWGYHFDQIIRERGGFDAIIANPPYEVFQTDEKEFFRKFSDVVKKKKTSILEFIEHRDDLLEDPEIRKAWLDYCSTFPHQNLYFKKAQQYKNQTSISKGKKVPSKNNLSKLFLEQCFNLLSDEGRCGIIMPTSIYVDGGAKQLREMLFSECKVDKLFALSNEKFIFEGVHHGFKFCLLTFLKDEDTEFFEAAFRINPREAIKPSDLEIFLNDKDDHVVIPVSVLRRLSPDSISVPEFRSKIDLSIAEKLAVLPMLGEELSNTWNLRLTTEFDKTATKDLFRVSPSRDSLVLYEGSMVHHFTHTFASPQYYIDSLKGKDKLSGKLGSEAYLDYRLVHRRVTGQVNERTLICSIIPKNCFCDNSVNFAIPGTYSKPELVFVCAILCSFVFDFQVRSRLNSNVTIGLMNQLSVPRLQKGDRHFSEIVERAAKLICTTPEFDDLAQEVGLGSHKNGVTDETQRAKLRAELDGIIAHLYNLTETEFTHILSTFPIVPEPTKQAALEAYRALIPLPGDQAIVALIAQGESATLEFKSTARWDLKEHKKNPALEQVILKTIAAFLNTGGGTLLIGIADNGDVIGLNHDYQTLQKKNRDGLELWLTDFLLKNNLGQDLAPYLQITFHDLDNQDICRIIAKPAPRPIYVKDNQDEHLYIRSGNSTRKLNVKEAINHVKNQWRN